MEMLATDKAGNVNVKRCGDGHVAEAKFSRLNEESATRRANDLQWVLQTPRKEHLAILPVGVDTWDAYLIGVGDAGGKGGAGNEAGAGKWAGRQPESIPSGRTDAAAGAGVPSWANV